MTDVLEVSSLSEALVASKWCKALVYFALGCANPPPASRSLWFFSDRFLLFPSSFTVDVLLNSFTPLSSSFFLLCMGRRDLAP